MPRRRAALAIACIALLGGAVNARPIEDPPPGMSAYVVGFLKQNRSHAGGGETEQLMAEHLAHLRALVVAGEIVAVGPMADEGEIRGVMIFRDMPADRARSLAEADPAVKSGHLLVEVHPWWGPKDIGVGYAERAKATPLERLPFAEYQFGLLTRGPAWTPAETPEIAKLQEAHLAHIRDMAARGKLVAAGPFTDGGTLRGIFLFAATADEAKALAAEDPMVKIGRLVLDLHPWMATEGVIPVVVRSP
jgi:uncharacterized protein YciI